jgi:hypothetical protein
MKIFNESGYNGMDCMCRVDESPDNCEHSCFINDPSFTLHMRNTYLTNETSSWIKDGQVNIPFTEE